MEHAINKNRSPRYSILPGRSTRSIFILFYIFIFSSRGIFSADQPTAYSRDVKNAEAFFIEVQGDVKIQQTGITQTGSVPAHRAVTGEGLFRGDTVRTGSDGRAIILFSGGTRIDLFANSQLQLREHMSEKKVSAAGRLWNVIRSKLDDTVSTGAQAGSIGALRAPEGEKEPANENISGEDRKSLDETLAKIQSEGFPDYTLGLMKAIAYEEYRQYNLAEKMYLDLIRIKPSEEVVYNMLIDLYMKLDLYAHAKKMQEQKIQILSGKKEN